MPDISRYSVTKVFITVILQPKAWSHLVAEERLMLHTESEKWRLTENSEPRGRIKSHTLSHLWIHTGTACNLCCPFCFEGSSPRDDRIEMITYEEVVKVIDEGVSLGPTQVAFTGGEPFVNPDMIRILDYTLDHLPALVLTNGTLPLQKQTTKLLPLRSKPYQLTLRISLDYPEPAAHDAGRGAGQFATSLETMQILHQAGFPLAVARISHPTEDSASVAEAYRQLFMEYGLPEDIPLVDFPVLAEPGELPDTPEITEHCIKTYCDQAKLQSFMCGYSKMAVKKHGEVRFYACTLVDDDDLYDLGNSLSEAMKYDIMLKHPRCFSCFSEGVTCDE
jgi:sulfatase maturation enzyme AslB (radical SAM superfamily)